VVRVCIGVRTSISTGVGATCEGCGGVFVCAMQARDARVWMRKWVWALQAVHTHLCVEAGELALLPRVPVLLPAVRDVPHRLKQLKVLLRVSQLEGSEEWGGGGGTDVQSGHAATQVPSRKQDDSELNQERAHKRCLRRGTRAWVVGACMGQCARVCARKGGGGEGNTSTPLRVLRTSW
jgi:hypothetical protein